METVYRHHASGRVYPRAYVTQPTQYTYLLTIPGREPDTAIGYGDLTIYDRPKRFYVNKNNCTVSDSNSVVEDGDDLWVNREIISKHHFEIQYPLGVGETEEVYWVDGFIYPKHCLKRSVLYPHYYDNSSHFGGLMIPEIKVSLISRPIQVFVNEHGRFYPSTMVITNGTDHLILEDNGVWERYRYSLNEIDLDNPVFQFVEGERIVPHSELVLLSGGVIYNGRYHSITWNELLPMIADNDESMITSSDDLSSSSDD